jgi:predicted Zn-dependent protease
MRHWISLSVVALLLTGSLIWSEVTKPTAPVSPEPILTLIADSERELTRLPVAFAPLPDREEIEAGNQFEKTYVGSFPSLSDEDRAIESYIQRVGAGVAAHAHRRLPYRFHYVPGLDFVNAFALPGGPVFIGGGLISLMNTEDELASVLGHEIEHIDRYHCAERIQVEAVLHHSLVGALVDLPVEIFIAGYSKSQELEADREGAKLAAMAGYSPQGAIQMFQAFERFAPQTARHAGTPQEELSNVALQTLEGYFRSHPLNTERIEQIQRMIAHGELPARQTTKSLPVAYFYLTERAWRDFQAARSIETAVSDAKLRREREAEQVRLYNSAIKLASQSLTLTPSQRAEEIIAISKVGLGDYAGAAAIYHQLLPQSPEFADDLRTQIDTFAQEALDAEQYDKAVALAKCSLDLQPNQRKASQILVEAQLSKGDVQGAIETGRRLQTMYPDSVQELSAYASQLAAVRFARKRYEEAAGVAAASLALQPNETDVLLILAKAQFALADFGRAAFAYRKLLDPDASDLSLVRSYADALSADSKSDAPRAFQAWMAGLKPLSPAVTTQLRIELAGLQLMSGDERLAASILADARSPGTSIAPELMGRLGWWYYRAHKYDDCAAVLRDALAQRPGDAELRTTHAWNEIEQHQSQDAIPIFAAVPADPEWNSPDMGRAVALWKTQRGDDAVKVFDAAVKSAPEWRNARWVQALYSPSVAQSIAQIDAESARRQTAKR